MTFEQFLAISALLIAGCLSLRVAWVCNNTRRYGVPEPDVMAWVGLSAVLLGYGLLKFIKGMGWFKGLGGWLRALARQHDLYAHRQDFQIIASATVAILAVSLLVFALIFAWPVIKRYWIALGFTSIAVGFGIIRFISLHDVDTLVTQMPWLRGIVELAAAIGASSVAISRLYYLTEK